MNMPRLCITEYKKSFRALLKKDDLTAAIQAMCILKGVGPAMASVMLTAADPNQCGFMADECLMAIPEIDSSSGQLQQGDFLCLNIVLLM